jgi:hypothetical protein
MIALKRQVNQLSAQLAQEPPYALGFLDPVIAPAPNASPRPPPRFPVRSRLLK